MSMSLGLSCGVRWLYLDVAAKPIDAARML